AREALVEQRLRERASRLDGAAADLGDAVGPEQPGRADQVGNELRGRVDPVTRLQRARGRAVKALVGAGGTQVGRFEGVHPSFEVSASAGPRLREELPGNSV